MKRNIEKIIEIPEGVDFQIVGNKIVISGKGKSNEKDISHHKVEIVKEGNKIKIISKKATKNELTIIGSVKAHILNMIKGLQDDYVYKLEICNVHFPMTAGVEGNQVVIKNFLGEKTKRTADIVEGTNVQIKGNEITIKSHNKESAGQTSANIEKATKIRNRDRRVFQDGIFITEKCGVKI